MSTPSPNLVPPDNARSSSYLSLKRFKDKASSLFSSSPRSQPVLSVPPTTLHGRRASSSAASTVKHFVLSTTKSITRKGRHARAQSESSVSRPGLSLLGSAPSPSPSFHPLSRSPSTPSVASDTNASPYFKPSFRHEDYPRSPIIQHADPDKQPSSTPRSPFHEATATVQEEADITVPALLQQGTPMLKISAKEKKNRVFRLDADLGQVLWQSKKSGIITIENIKEIRSGPETRYYREQFNIALAFEERWLTLIYITDGKYKTLHIVAFTSDVFHMWNTTLRRLHSLRQDLMSGLGNMERRQMIWEKQYWKDADQSGDHKVTFEEIEQMCKRLNINSPRSDLLNRFMEADVRSRGYLDFTDFRRFVTLLKSRPDISTMYAAAKGSNSEFTFEVFENFMRNSQHSDLGRPELIKLFTRYGCRDLSAQTLSTQMTETVAQPVIQSPESCSGSSQLVPLTSPPNPPTLSTKAPSTPSPSSIVPPGDIVMPSLSWSIAAFTSFLLSADNSPFQDHAAKAWHDMSRPLSEYFISSSHNTYLVGHQLIGDSTIEGYIRALLHGCRSVELDIWDGDDGPAIFHGRTLTSKIPLADVIRAIAKYAFVASPYPVVISAEIHCSLEQQEMAADVMKREFGDMLVTSPIDEEEIIEELPSPEQLKHRILLKAKNLFVISTTVDALPQPVDPVESPLAEASSTETSNSDFEPVKELKPEVSRARSLVSRVREKVSSPQSSDSNSTPSALPNPRKGLAPPEEYNVARRNSQTSERPKLKMSMSLASLLVYTVGVKCRGLNKKEEYAVEHVFSLSEKQANRMLKESMTDLIKHNRTHIVRVYPNGTRLSSSNYEPHRYWASGAQLVAINWQTFDLGYMMNYAMFQRNGRSGYVLKPFALRSKDKEPLTKRTKHFLDVTIISAQQLPHPKDQNGREISTKHTVDPCVEVSVHVPEWSHASFLPEQSSPYSLPKNELGGSSSNASSARTISRVTSVVKNNGFNPVWQETMSIPFDCVGDMKDLIFVRFQVKDEYAGTDLAVYCISLGSLMPGFRHLPLHDKQLSQYLFSTLFVHTSVRDVLE